MNLSAPFILRPVMTTFVMLTIILAGVMAFFKLPVSDLPPIDHPQIQIIAGYPGANSETVLNQVTIPLEKELTSVKGVEEMSSKSSSGSSSISLKFDLNKSMEEAIREVQSALNRAGNRLPRDLDPHPTYRLHEDNQEPIMHLLLTSDHASVQELRSYADTYIIPRLIRIEGIANVEAYGSPKAIWLRLNPELMAARQIGFNQVIETVRQQTEEIPLGSIQTNSKRLSIELPTTIFQAKDLENIKIGKTSVRIKDIGEVSDKSKEEVEFHFVTKDKTSNALIMGIQKINDANSVEISKNVQKTLASIEKELPSTLALTLWFDKAVWINDSIWDVQWSLLFAFVLVVLVIYFSLGRISESLIASAALPLSLIGTFIIMYLLHFSLDLLSLLALTLSVGFVVDDAIVVLENIVRWQEKGNSPKQASLMGSKQICFTILSMTLSLVAVFIPLLFMGGINGRLFREFSITLAVAILVSGFISLTLTPMLCSRFLSEKHEETKLQKAIIGINAAFVSIYGKSLKFCFNYPKSMISVAFICMGATVFLFSKLPVNLVPAEDRGFLMAFVNLPSGLSPAQTNEEQKKLEALLLKNPYIDKFLSIHLNDSVFFMLRLPPLSERPPQPQVIAQLKTMLDSIPGTQTSIRGYQLINLDFDYGSGGDYKLIVQGLNPEDVEKETLNLTKELQSNREFISVYNSLRNDSPTLAMTLNDELIHKFDLNKQQVQMLLQNAFGQLSAGSIQEGPIQKKIYVELLDEYRNHAKAPEKLFLTTPSGTTVPLKALIDWKEKLSSQALVRHEQLPVATIRFSLADNVSPNEGLAYAEEIAKATLPANVTGTFTGSAKNIASTIQDTLMLMLAAAVVMYIVLGILYESFIHPLTILSSLPFAGLGGVLTLFLFNEPISIFSAVGFLLLIGIVKKNGIMMVDYAVEAQKKGSQAKDAIFEACIVRFRPIMMTTVVAIMGAIPIAIGFGEGAEMHRGLGLVIAGGLLFSQLLTLYVTPIFYLVFEKLSKSQNLDNDRNLLIEN